jgi:hypothetical protein
MFLKERRETKLGKDATDFLIMLIELAARTLNRYQ